MIRFPRRLVVILGLCGMVCLAQSSGIWLDIPFFKQDKNGCGAASIAMVMEYWRNSQHTNPAAVPAAGDPELIQRALYSPKERGIRASDMQHYLEEHGFRTFVFRGDWDVLKRHLEKGRPLIVALKPLATETALHYVVVAGLDWRQKLVLVNDAAQRKLLKEDRAEFEREWSAVDRWTLLAIPRAQE